MTSLDHAVNNDLLIVAKSLVPYLDIQRQKTIAILLKAIELLYTINFYSNPEKVLELSQSQEPGWEKAFLKDVKENLDNEKAYFIDVILKLSEAKDLLMNPDTSLLSLFTPNTPEQVETTQIEKVEAEPVETTPTPAPTISMDQIMSSLSSILDPNSTQLLNALAAFFKPNPNHTATTTTQAQS